jgi:hypothetical protein
MNAFNLKEKQIIPSPFSKEVQEMLTVVSERMVTFHDGAIGFIINEYVIAPFHQKTSCMVQKEGHPLVLTHAGVSKWNISYFQLPFSIACEPFRFRPTPVTEDTYLFRVNSKVALCQKEKVKRGNATFCITSPDDFCLVFDRFAHIVAVNTGLFKDKPICIKIREVI